MQTWLMLVMGELSFAFQTKARPSADGMCCYALTDRIAGHPRLLQRNLRLEIEGKSIRFSFPKRCKAKSWRKTIGRQYLFDLGCLCALLTLPGDGRFPNYVKERKTLRLFCIDNDISFVEPVTQSLFSHQTHFNSALFCLNPQPLILPY